MSVQVVEVRRLSATAVFDLEDRYARDRGVWGSHPRPIEPVTIRLLADIVAGAPVPLALAPQLVVTRNPSGYHLFYGLIRTPPDDRLSRLELPRSYVIRVESPFYQSAERTVALPAPRDPERIALEPGHAYPFPDGRATPAAGQTLLRGTVHRMDGQSVSGTAVEVVGVSNVYRTDESGCWALVFPDAQASGDVSVRIVFPDGTVQDVQGVAVERQRDRSLKDTALRGWVLVRGVGVGGATLRVANHPGQAVTASNGSWFYYFDPNQPEVTVAVAPTLPDGRTLPPTDVNIQRHATVVVPTFRFA
jgi:hypothetical protein